MQLPGTISAANLYKEQNVHPIKELPGPYAARETNGANQYKLKQLVMIDNAAPRGFHQWCGHFKRTLITMAV